MSNANYAKQGYLYEDFRLFHLRSTAGVRSEYHYHEFYKVLILVSGSGAYWVEGQRYDLQPGDVVLVGSNSVHRPEFEPGATYERIIIYIKPEFLAKASVADCDLTQIFSGVLRPDKSVSHLLQTMAQNLERELAGEEYGREIIGNGLLMQLLVQISRQLRRGESLHPGVNSAKDARISKILSYIDTHLGEELSVESIAEQFYLSKFHMMRLFRSGTGTSVNAYIIQRRLMLARELIAQGTPATESCFRAGFGSYSAFTRAYGKYFGTTPTGRNSTAPLVDEGFE